VKALKAALDAGGDCLFEQFKENISRPPLRRGFSPSRRGWPQTVTNG